MGLDSVSSWQRVQTASRFNASADREDAFSPGEAITVSFNEEAGDYAEWAVETRTEKIVIICSSIFIGYPSTQGVERFFAKMLSRPSPHQEGIVDLLKNRQFDKSIPKDSRVSCY